MLILFGTYLLSAHFWKMSSLRVVENFVVSIDFGTRGISMKYQMQSSGMTAKIRYIVVDAGGGTVDIVAHEQNQDGTVQEIASATGGPWGSTCVDAEFIHLLCQVFQSIDLKSWLHSNQRAGLIYELRNSFEGVKNIRRTSDTNMTVRLPSSLASFLRIRIVIS